MQSVGRESERRVVVGISGASGTIYGVRLLQALRDTSVRTHLILTNAARDVIRHELESDPEEVEALADEVHDDDDLAAAVSSGSFVTHGMAIAPCSIKSLSAVAHSYNDNLLSRAADVTLKERRPLVLVVRETPLHRGHLRLLLEASESGAIILPPVPAFYHRPTTLDDIIDHTVGKILESLGIGHELYRRWGS